MIVNLLDFYVRILALFGVSTLSNGLDATTQTQVENAIHNALDFNKNPDDTMRLGIRMSLVSYARKPVPTAGGEILVEIVHRTHVQFLDAVLPGLAEWLETTLENLINESFPVVDVLPPLDPQHPTGVAVIHRNQDFAGERTDKRPSEAYIIVSPNQIRVIEFHEGTNPNMGTNGFLNEDLIAVLLHRTNQHQAGPFASRENALCATALEQAGLWLYAHRVNRRVRGVSGTQKV